MSKVALSGNASGTGTFTIASPNSNSDVTLSLPTASGTLNTSGSPNEVPAGSASAPAIYPTGDTNTGIFFPAADTIAFTEGGTESMRIDASGNVGIGTSSPSVRLQYSGAFDAGVAGRFPSAMGSGSYGGGIGFLDNAVAGIYTQDNGGSLMFFTGQTGSDTAASKVKMKIDSSGNVGIGTSSPSTYVSNGGLAILGTFGTSSKALTIYNNSGASASNVARIDFKLNNTFSNGSTSAAIYGMNPNAAGNNGGALVVATSSDGTDTNPSERARIDSSGRLLVGTTSAPGQTGGVIVADDELFVYNIPTTASGANCHISSGENNRFYRSTSALKYKQDIRDLESIDINAFRPVRYKSKCENDDQTKDHFGFIADEAAEAGFEELVSRGIEGEVEGFQYDRMTVVLLKAIQELKAIVDAQGAEIAALKGQA